MNKILIGGLLGILVLAGLIWIARPGAESAASVPAATSNGVLAVQETSNYEFGTISMAAGEVSRMFTITNTSDEAVVINKIYTSCMCTTAMLSVGERRFGPYGMPGHGAIPNIGQSIEPGAEVTVEVVFDPAAHGPAGVGKIARTVTIENNAGQPVELQFSAVVTP